MAQTTEPNQIYQYSLISALMTGLASASSSTPVSNLLSRGNLGLGTFESIDGEMVILDSTAYQLKSDGSVTAVPPATTMIPFGTVTHFSPTSTISTHLTDKAHLLSLLTDLLPHARNHFVIARVEGKFDMLRCRTAPKQRFAGEHLTEVGKRQTVKDYHDIEGTIVGFRSPQWSSAVSVAGIHVHFLDKERKVGGHVLLLEAKETKVVLEVATCKDLRIQLPESDEFGARDLEDDEEGLQKVEG